MSAPGRSREGVTHETGFDAIEKAAEQARIEREAMTPDEYARWYAEATNGSDFDLAEATDDDLDDLPLCTKDQR